MLRYTISALVFAILTVGCTAAPIDPLGGPLPGEPVPLRPGEETEEWLSDGDRVLENQMPYDQYEISAQRGDRISIVITLRALYPTLILQDSQGQEIARSQGGNDPNVNSANLDANAPETGEYRVIVTKGGYPLSGAGGRWPYRLRYRVAAARNALSQGLTIAPWGRLGQDRFVLEKQDTFAPGQIPGVVVVGYPVEEVRVTVWRASNGEIVAETASLGRFALLHLPLPPGTYRVELAVAQVVRDTASFEVIR